MRSTSWSPAAFEKADAVITGDPAFESDLALYIHWPFCLSKCPYCDFNSHVREQIDEARWRSALLRDLNSIAEATPKRRIASIFFGGGTPSLMSPGTVAALLDQVAQHWSFSPDAEITLEANPTSVERQRLADIRAAGVNRVSLGVQALDDEALAFLGRGHSADEALAAVGDAARLFDRFSFDLIYGRPEQSAAAWRDELGRALHYAGDHLSVYQLTLEPGTPFHALWRRGRLDPLAEEEAADLYDVTQEILAVAGLPAYEISNHAAPGAESRHNLIYWRYGDYAGIGPGAHGRVTLGGEKAATQRIRSPEAWLEQVETKGHGAEPSETLSAETQFSEIVLMGLRLAEGIPESRIQAVGGAFDPDRLKSLTENGLIERSAGRIRATEAGRTRLDAVIAHLLG
ncbi:MAG: coproporphyrinogen III oxidase [Alphaproteobacteria bacterium]|nr:coproporphyrinogen III oxidase [Alphaproteobacteria bacterium]